MGIYGHKFDTVLNQIDDTNIFELTQEEATDLMNKLNEALVEHYEEIEFEEEALIEGANLEIRDIYKDYKSQVKKLKKQFKKDYKSDKKKSLEDLKDIKKLISDTRKKIKAVDANSLTSTIIGSFVAIALDVLRWYVGMFIAGAIGGAVGGSVAAAKVVGDFKKGVDNATAAANAVKIGKNIAEPIASAGDTYVGAKTGSKVGGKIVGLINNLIDVKKKVKGETVVSALNMYRNEVIGALDIATVDIDTFVIPYVKNQIKKEEEQNK